MRQAKVYFNGIEAGRLMEKEKRAYRFEYLPSYQGSPISLTLPVEGCVFDFENFPAFFEGLLPEDFQLGAINWEGTRWRLRHHLYKNQDTLAAVIVVEGSWFNLKTRKLSGPIKELVDIFNQLPRGESFEDW
ncbi:MAG: HipA N-terminal domain-containing protein [Deltaproteobacteria bacterium]|nr:HipA N-terminal domain-containing protein [Deltaproteobacteria bacterium]